MSERVEVETLIIGSGVAATAVAKELLGKNPKARILILEAGPRIEMKNFQLWENYMITGQKPYAYCEDLPYPSKDSYGQNHSIGSTTVPLNGSRLMIYGGSTVHWGGWSFRLKPEDFRLRTNTSKGADWPFDYAELEPFYGQAERFIGVAGDNDSSPCPRTDAYPFPAYPYTLEDSLMIEALEALELGYNHLPIARHGVADTTAPTAPCMTTGTCKYCPFGARFVAGNTLDLLRADHPSLEVRHDAVVERLDMSGARRVSGCTYTDRRERKTVEVGAQRVIVAAGAIESPKLLLRSRTPDWESGIGNAHDLLGRNLITHPYFIFQAELRQNPHGLRPEMDFPTLCSRHFDSRDEQCKGKFMFINPPGSPSIDIAKMMKKGMSREAIDAALVGETTIQIQGMLEVFSDPKNRVYNHDELNQFGLPQTVVDYSKPADFDDRMAEIEAIVGQIFARMGAVNTQRVTVSWRADHAAATCRMAADPEQGVVDANLKVHGVDNLYICSNAVFPSLGAVNPTLTLGALSLRLGQHLAGLQP